MKTGANSHSLSRAILQHTARAEAVAPLCVIALDRDSRLDPRRVSLTEAAEHLIVFDAHTAEDLDGVNVVMIPGGQKDHRLFENAESRRRSRMLELGTQAFARSRAMHAVCGRICLT